jgi:HEAT repeat protein
MRSCGQVFTALVSYFVLALPAAPSSAANANPAEALASLVARIPQVARGEPGISPQEGELAKAIQAHGAEAIPLVLPLLKSEKANVRSFAGYVLRDLNGLTEDQLGPLMDAMKSGDGWIAPAIGHIGTPRAIAFLVSQFKANPERYTQTTYALQLAGAPAAVALAHELESGQHVSSDYIDGICHLFGEMGNVAAAALDPLVTIASTQRFATENRLLAVRTIGCLALAARPAIPKLRALAKDDKRFADAVDSAVMQIGSPEAAPAYAAELRVHPTENLLRDIAEKRESLRDVGPAVMEQLASEDWDLRVAAARCLGYIGFAEAEPNLVAALSDVRDWRLPYVSSESLGRLHARGAVTALLKLKSEHWYPPVREAAAKAIEVIEHGGQYTSRFPPYNFPMEFYGYMSLEGIPEASHAHPPLKTGPDELSKDDLTSLGYDAKRVGYDSVAHRMRESSIRAAPVCGIRVDGGSVLGSSRGEWGGELVYVDAQGAVNRLVSSNTRAIHRMPFGIVAVTGLAHLAFSQGGLYRIDRSREGFKATKWRTLPGAPRESGFLANGDLFIACDGGDIVITPSGELRMADDGNRP